MFSSIEVQQRLEVIQRCYWPLLKLIKECKLKAGIELPAYTLEEINQLDCLWVRELKSLIQLGNIELVGSGYSQAIGPLMSVEANAWNQAIGINIYQEILGVKPNIALINEMAYSVGVLEHYKNTGYKAVIMEWNNPYKYHPEWDKNWRYNPQTLTDLQGRDIPVIWADSIVFQKFQRYVHGEIDLDEYLEFINSFKVDATRYFPIYSNDVEIFDFRPGRFKTEANIVGKESEWKKIEILFKRLQQDKEIEMVLPSEVLQGLDNILGGNKISLESPEEPIPVKKQEKYNINRWALTGRGDQKINTTCFALSKALSGSKDEEQWKELCYLWSSDFRTHITQKRWDDYCKRLELFKNKHLSQAKRENVKLLPEIDIYTCCAGRFIKLKTKDITFSLNYKKGLVIDSLSFFGDGKSLIGSLQHGYYDDIAYGADFYSGHAIIEASGEHKVTDLSSDAFSLYGNERMYQLKMKNVGADITFEKFITIDEDTISLDKKITAVKRKSSVIHPFCFTFIPDAWDMDTLYFETNNGGSSLERFNLQRPGGIDHGNRLSSLISAKHALGATKGIIIVGDKDKQLIFSHDIELSAMIPTIILKKTGDGKMFFRLQYSVQEIDETFKESDEPQTIECLLKISAKKSN
jgi:hypothetical protein